MKVIYIAGAFRADTQWQIRCNVHAAECAAYEVAQLGAMPLIPHANTEHFHGSMPDEFWLRGTLELMYRCDAILVLRSWAHSDGTKAEMQAARNVGLPVFMSRTALADWIFGARESSPDVEVKQLGPYR